MDTLRALVWHFNLNGKIDRVVNLSGDQHQMDDYVRTNDQLAPPPSHLG